LKLQKLSRITINDKTFGELKQEQKKNRHDECVGSARTEYKNECCGKSCARVTGRKKSRQKLRVEGKKIGVTRVMFSYLHLQAEACSARTRKFQLFFSRAHDDDDI